MFSFDPAIFILLYLQCLVSECTQKYLLIELLRAVFLQVKHKDCLVEDGNCNCKVENNKSCMQQSQENRFAARINWFHVYCVL